MGTARRALVFSCLGTALLIALTTVLVGDSWKGARHEPRVAAEPITPLPKQMHLDRGKVDLGRRLFLDPQLSRDGTIACASCHGLQTGGTDRRRRSLGIGGAEGDINAPTVYNSGFNFRQFWDGRAATLEDQVEGPLNHPKEMASS